MNGHIDSIDKKILEILRHSARSPIIEIAKAVNLSAAPVQRRIKRLEKLGIILGYQTKIDDHKTGTLEAFVEVRLDGPTETSEVAEIIQQIPEAEEFHTLSGDPDILVRVYANGVDHLQRIVNSIRRTGKVSGTKTQIVLHSWSRSTN